MDCRQDIRMLIAENYNAHICDVGKPIIIQNSSEVLQQYSLLVMDETKALIFGKRRGSSTMATKR
eukprot:10059435-Ditylum_brightwellii.AAC.1